MQDKVVIPTKLRQEILQILHSNHLGLTRMKQVARMYVYWPKLNEDLESYVKQCEACQVLRKNDLRKVYGAWPEVKLPFETSILFHFKGNTILIDTFSRWLEVRQMKETSAKAVNKVLSEMF